MPMHRRNAIKLFGAGACLAALPRAVAAAKPRPQWKIAVGLNGFASGTWKYKKTYPIWEVLDFASRNGFQGVELMGNWPMGDYPPSSDAGRIAALKRLYDAYGLTIFSLQSVAHDAFSPDAAVPNAGWNSFATAPA